MANLIGLVIGSTLARNADVSAEDVPRFALLGAVSPSPLLGAVVVNAALAQRGNDSTYEPRAMMSRGANVVEQLQRQLQRRREREQEQEQAREREQERERRQRRRRQEVDALQQVTLAIAVLQESVAQRSQGAPSFGAAMGGVQDALAQLDRVVRSDRETGDRVLAEDTAPSDRE